MEKGGDHPIPPAPGGGRYIYPSSPTYLLTICRATRLQHSSYLTLLLPKSEFWYSTFESEQNMTENIEGTINDGGVWLISILSNSHNMGIFHFHFCFELA